MRTIKSDCTKCRKICTLVCFYSNLGSILRIEEPKIPLEENRGIFVLDASTRGKRGNRGIRSTPALSWIEKPGYQMTMERKSNRSEIAKCETNCGLLCAEWGCDILSWLYFYECTLRCTMGEGWKTLISFKGVQYIAHLAVRGFRNRSHKIGLHSLRL